MTDEAKELHRIISASVKDMLDAYRIQAQPGPVTDKALEQIILPGGARHHAEPRAVPRPAASCPAAQRCALHAGEFP